MGTEKRERQKANRAMRQVEAAKAAKQSQTKRNVIRWSAAILAAFAAVVAIAWIGGAFDDDDDAITSATLPPTVESTFPFATETTVADITETTVADDDDATATTVADDDPTATTVTEDDAGDVADDDCPTTDGSEEPRQEFTSYPAMCIDPANDYTAEIVTTQGTMTVELFADRAPLAVNSFVTLARYHYFDGVPCHRIIPGFVAQCGDPTGTGTGGPGYSFEDELPDAGEYQIGSLAMANSGPNTNGSQFFIITGDEGVALPPLYSLFGVVTDGLDTTVPALDAVGNPSGGVPPLEPVEIESVTITES